MDRIRLSHVFGASLLLLMGACARQAEVAQPAAAPAPDPALQLAAANKEVALAFFYGVFRDKKPREAFDRYSVPAYIQHNPLAADGAEAAIVFLDEWLAKNPQAGVDVKKVIAEGNLVAIHHHLRTSPEVAGLACTEWYRVEDGKVVEHWDTAQNMPAESKNPHPMF